MRLSEIRVQLLKYFFLEYDTTLTQIFETRLWNTSSWNTILSGIVSFFSIGILLEYDFCNMVTEI